MAEDGGMLAKNRLSQNPFAIKTATPTRSLADSTEGKETRPVLAPPTLKWGNDVPCGVSSSKVLLRPSALSAQAEKLKNVNTEGENSNSKNDEAGCSSANNDGPDSSLSASNAFLAKDEAGVSQSSFVFGQNLHERVLANFGEKINKEIVSEEPKQNEELTFEAAASFKESVLTENTLEQSPEAKPSKSLTESAEEYQSRQVKRKFSEVTVVTGEEEESNVLQISCKLFSFNKLTGTWQERGRGILRLNDKEVEGILHSRLVMRTHGSLRVVMNTKIWEGMTVEHPSTKTVRISALDPEGLKVYLIMAGTKDVETLFSALDWRVTMLKSDEERLGGDNGGGSGGARGGANNNNTSHNNARDDHNATPSSLMLSSSSIAQHSTSHHHQKPSSSSSSSLQQHGGGLMTSSSPGGLASLGGSHHHHHHHKHLSSFADSTMNSSGGASNLPSSTVHHNNGVNSSSSITTTTTPTGLGGAGVGGPPHSQSSSNSSPPAPKRWRHSEPQNHHSDDADQPESSTASGSISPAEGDLSSDSGFPTTEDS